MPQLAARRAAEAAGQAIEGGTATARAGLEASTGALSVAAREGTQTATGLAVLGKVDDPAVAAAKDAKTTVAQARSLGKSAEALGRTTTEQAARAFPPAELDIAVRGQMKFRKALAQNTEDALRYVAFLKERGVQWAEGLGKTFMGMSVKVPKQAEGHHKALEGSYHNAQRAGVEVKAVGLFPRQLFTDPNINLVEYTGKNRLKQEVRRQPDETFVENGVLVFREYKHSIGRKITLTADNFDEMAADAALRQKVAGSRVEWVVTPEQGASGPLKAKARELGITLRDGTRRAQDGTYPLL